MPPTECPECGRPLGEEDVACTQCGWPHDSPAAATRADSSIPGTAVARPAPEVASGARSPLGLLLIGLAVGLIVGVLIGRASVPGDREAVPGPAEGEEATPGTAATRILRPQPLRLRELEWKQSSAELCKGMFEVVTAPPNLTALSFTVLDEKGAVIGSDRVSAPDGIRPKTVLELGFEVGDCAKIKKWKVKKGQ